jgi:flavin reductase (DIM6/NTAB) family NADH-FMN oxidoreductase RutF
MFYDTAADNHGLKHNPFKALIVPRPIGWIGTRSKAGICNLAPYSFFNAVSDQPPVVMFASAGHKDSLANIEETGEFTCSLTSYDMAQQMSLTSAPLPRGQSEYAFAGLETAPSELVRPPRVKGAPAALECKLLSVTALHDLTGKPIDRYMVLGQVVSVFIDERCLIDGRFDMTAARTIARCGYSDYTVIDTLFSIQRPPGG